MHSTLHDYTVYVKTAGYLMAAILLIGIIPFWMYMTGGDKKKK